jgi:hypothetical protein
VSSHAADTKPRPQQVAKARIAHSLSVGDLRKIRFRVLCPDGCFAATRLTINHKGKWDPGLYDFEPSPHWKLGTYWLPERQRRRAAAALRNGQHALFTLWLWSFNRTASNAWHVKLRP